MLTTVVMDSLMCSCMSELAASPRPGMTALVNRRLFHGLTKARLQKIEIAAFIGLLDVL
jgi:hypothetical protein